MNEHNSFVIALKKQLLHEFSIQDRKGVYAITQKNMAYNSNKIEGSTLTGEQTASLFDTGTIISNGDFIYRAKDVEEMTGHFKMFNEVLKSLDLPLSSEIIKSFHYQLKSGVFEDYANGYPIGEFKNRANAVSDITTELPQNVPQKLESLVNEYNNSKKQLIDITRFHAEYELIHPFQDGNGRTGRAIILKQCLDSNIMPVIITDDKKEVYIHSLHIAQIEKNYTVLYNFFENMQNEYYEKIKDYVVIPSQKTVEASSVMNKFLDEISQTNISQNSIVNTCDLYNSVRCIIRANNLMIVADFIENSLNLFYNQQQIFSNNLELLDKHSYNIYSTVKKAFEKSTNPPIYTSPRRGLKH